MSANWQSKGREQRELADDHPIKAIYNRRMNTILQSTRRGKLDEGVASAMKKLAKDKMLRALSDHRYASTVYETGNDPRCTFEGRNKRNKQQNIRRW